MEENLIHYIYSHRWKKNDLCDYLVIKLKNNGVDLSKNNLLNNFLPKEDLRKENQLFFISSLDTSKIKNLLEYGFTFDEKNYSFHGDNLFIAVVKSKRLDLVQLILPFIKDITPKSGTIEEQNAFVDSLSSNIKSDTEQESYELIKTCYQKCLLEQQLERKNTEPIKNKMKI